VDDSGSASAAAGRAVAVTAPLTFAARPAADRPVERFFNGRIDGPRLFPDIMAAEQPAMALEAGDGGPRALAAWDFSIGIPTDVITDVSGSGLHGRLVNLPTRGVCGRNWCGREHDWRRCPDHYGAIHFHDDDLYDAGWQVDFSFQVPPELASGVYAVQLTADGDEYFVVFCVRPPPGRAGAAAAFLMPTASYMAYANNRIGLDVPETELVCGRLIQLTRHDLFLQEHPELGLCFYDLHNDGSPVHYSSRLRPVIDMQPKFVGKLGGAGSNVWQFNADTHILGWLDHLHQPFDVVTDEDLDREGPALLADYRVVITGTHPEYTSLSMLDALQRFVDGGGRLMYLGGNGFYWRIAFHPHLPGVIECRKSEDGIRAAAPEPGEYYASFTGEYTGLWRRNGRPPNRLVGVGMAAQGFDVSSPYRRTAASRDARAEFVFAGVDAEWIGDFGLSGGAAAGIEIDAADLRLGTPSHALVLASSERHTDVYLVVPEDMLDPVPGLGGSEAESIHSDMVFFETPGGGAVFSTGSIAWAGAMAWNGYDNHVALITANVLRRFLDPASFE
jgi:N,N-dimethylformamidase